MDPSPSQETGDGHFTEVPDRRGGYGTGRDPDGSGIGDSDNGLVGDVGSGRPKRVDPSYGVSRHTRQERVFLYTRKDRGRLSRCH